MISSDVSTEAIVIVPADDIQHASSSPEPKPSLGILQRIAWVFLFLACLGTGWFSYQYFLVPQPKSFAPDWQGAQWVQAADSKAPVAYFRYVTDLSVLPDGAFVTVAASQVFRLYVNGTFIGSNVLDFAQGKSPRTYMYDLAPAFQPGSNVIALRVANVDRHAPSVRLSLGIIWGKFVSYRGTGSEWQATAQSTFVYPRYATNSNAWTTNAFAASSWQPAQVVANPSLSPLLTVNPLIYEQPVARYWMSAGGSHDAYFVRQLSLPGSINEAWLRIAATGNASIFINGHLFIIWDGQAPLQQQDFANYLSDNESVTQSPPELVVGIYDISPYVHAGMNTIAVRVAAPGVSSSIVGLNTLTAALSLDTLVTDSQGHQSWLTSDAGWHASVQPVDGWTQGSGSAFAWPRPILIGHPAVSHTFYLPDNRTTQGTIIIPLLLLSEVILLSVGAVLGLWLLLALGLMRRFFRSRRTALETASLAFLPALACEALLLALSREPQIPQPFPYTWQWGLILVGLVGVSSILIWLNIWKASERPRSAAAGAGWNGEGTFARNDKTDRGSSSRTNGMTGGIEGLPCNGAGASPPHASSSEKQYHKGLLPIQHRPSGRYDALIHKLWGGLRLHWPIIPLFLLAIPLIAYNLSYEPYWQDELTSYYAAKGILAHGIPILYSGFIYPKGELYSYLLAFSMLIFGDQGGAPRILSVLEYMVSLPLLYTIGCYFFDRRISLLATAMLALSPFALLWGRQVRMYEQAQLMTLVVVYIFYKALREPQRARLAYLAVACLIVDYLSHEEIFIILPALVLCVLIFSRDTKQRIMAVLRQKHWWYAAVIGASIIGLQLLVVHLTHPPILGTDQSQKPLVQFTTENIPFYVKLLFIPGALNSGLPWITVNSLLATAGCLLAIYSRDKRAKYLTLFLLTSLLTLVLIFTFQADRYIYPLLPIYYLMGAYAMLTGLRAIWAFARSHLVLEQPGQLSSPVSRGSRPILVKAIAVFTAGLLCVCVLILPMLPISGYNAFISQQAGFSYHRHFPDYDVIGEYMQKHWRKGDIVIAVSPAISVLYYVGHVDYFMSIDRALYLFERNGHIIDTPTSSIEALLSQDDFQAVLATKARIWIISDNGAYQAEVIKRFVFPSDFHIVYEGYRSAIYFRGS